MILEVFLSKFKRWRFLNHIDCTTSKRAKIVCFFTKRVLVVLEPLDDGGWLSTFSKTLIHFQLLTNLILNNHSINLILLNLVTFDLANQITFPNAELFTPLENTSVETFHFAFELLEISSEILHLHRSCFLFG